MKLQQQSSAPWQAAATSCNHGRDSIPSKMAKNGETTETNNQQRKLNQIHVYLRRLINYIRTAAATRTAEAHTDTAKLHKFSSQCINFSIFLHVFFFCFGAKIYFSACFSHLFHSILIVSSG